MTNIKILILDDKEANTKTTRQALEDSFMIEDKNLFPQNIDDEIINFSNMIKASAESNSIEEYAGWLNDYIEKKDIDIIILDLALTKDEHKGKIENTSGITLVNSFINTYSQKNHLKYIPIILFSAMHVENLSSVTKANAVYAFQKPNSYNVETAEKVFKKHKLTDIIEKHANKYKWLKETNCFKGDNTFDYNLAIICATKKEFDYIKDLSDSWYELKINGKTYYRTYFIKDKKRISVIARTENEMGMVESATLATTMINYFNPQYIAMTGIAAGIKDEGIELGDIVIPKMVWNWQSGKFKIIDDKSVFDRDNIKIPLDEDLADAVEKIKDDNSFLSNIFDNFKKDIDKKSKLSVRPNIVTENMVSGSAVVANSSMVSTEIGSRKLVSIDMEAYGVFCAAKKSTKNGAEAIVIKSICDFADAEKNDDYQEFSAYASAQTLYKLATEYIEFDND